MFGRRQDPDGAYAAVIPNFIKQLLNNEQPTINGDGKQSRDFTYIENVIEANLKACLAPSEAAGQSFNIAYGGREYLIEIYYELCKALGKDIEPIFGPDRPGDIKHSNALVRPEKCWGMTLSGASSEELRRLLSGIRGICRKKHGEETKKRAIAAACGTALPFLSGMKSERYFVRLLGGAMFISSVQIEGYKNANKASTISLNKGLNILVGENGSGKTAVINALRLILRETESYSDFSEDDIYCSLDKKQLASEIVIDVSFADLSEDEKITFLSWCGSDFNAYLHLTISENNYRPGFFKRKFWGGNSSASIFEEDTFDRIECIYLPPLRDAESKLSNGRKSRLAFLLRKQYGDNTHALVDSVKDFNDSITENRGGKHSEIDLVRQNINTKIKESLGSELGQSVNLQFSEITFNKIIQNIKMVFFPHIGEKDISKFRDLATNSLGYNNLLYIATVFAELELIKDSDIFTALLIEEPEAHLHPQLQIKFVKYLEELSTSLPNAQIIVSTHSPVLASSVSVRNIIHISDQNNEIVTINLNEKDYGDVLTEKYINRWLDVTKSTLLFSRGIILVEGIAEALILPQIGKLILKEYNEAVTDTEKKPLASSLEEMGVSVININGINFKYFMKLFGNFSGASGPNIPIYCAALSDKDPQKEIFPLKDEIVDSKNPVMEYIDEINKNKYTRLFISPLKTFEYDIAILNPVTLAKALKDLWPTKEGEVTSRLDKIITRAKEYVNPVDLREDAKYIYKHIESSLIGKGVFAYTLAESIGPCFKVPEYIKKAILWACGGIESNE